MRLCVNGEWITLCELSFLYDIPYTTVCWRARHGWSVEEIISGKHVDTSVDEYCRASDLNYISEMGYTTQELFALYKKWCHKEMLEPLDDLKTFTKQIGYCGLKSVREGADRVFRKV